MVTPANRSDTPECGLYEVQVVSPAQSAPTLARCGGRRARGVNKEVPTAYRLVRREFPTAVPNATHNASYRVMVRDGMDVA